MSNCVVYALVSSRDPEDIRYIGQTSRKPAYRLTQHLKLSKRPRVPVQWWIARERREGHDVLMKILEHEAVFNITEVLLIAEYKARGSNLLNLTAGGDGVRGYSGSKGKPKSDAHRAAISLSHRGRVYPPLSEETKRKISAFNAGKTLTQEHRAKIAAAHTGKHKSESHKAALSASKMGKRLSLSSEQESRRKLMASAAEIVFREKRVAAIRAYWEKRRNAQTSL